MAYSLRAFLFQRKLKILSLLLFQSVFPQLKKEVCFGSHPCATILYPQKLWFVPPPPPPLQSYFPFCNSHWTFRGTERFWVIVGSLLHWNLSLGTPVFREHKLWLRNKVFIKSLYLLPLLKGHPWSVCVVIEDVYWYHISNIKADNSFSELSIVPNSRQLAT